MKMGELIFASSLSGRTITDAASMADYLLLKEIIADETLHAELVGLAMRVSVSVPCSIVMWVPKERGHLSFR